MTTSGHPFRVLFHEGSITVPSGFDDRTTNVFVPANTETQPNLSIARDWLREGETLPQYIDRQLALLKSRLPGHKLQARAPEQAGQGDAALTGERIDASHKSGDRTVHQRQAAFIVAPPRVIIFTASSAKPPGKEFDAFWREWLGSYLPPAAAE